MDTENRPLLVIDMVADPVCPWCYIGKRNLDRAAMALSFQYTVERRYRPYQLAPETPVGGVDRAAHLAQKFPDAAQREAMAEALSKAAQNAGLVLDPKAPDRLPNTIMAHRLIRWAHLSGCQTDLVEALYEAYWHDGADIGDAKTLARLGQETGMEGDLASRLQGDDDTADVMAEAAAFREGGVTGVPTYIVNELAGFAGALPADQLLTTFRQLAEETPGASQ